MFTRVFRPTVFAGLVIVISACQPQRSPVGAGNVDTLAARVGQSETSSIAVRSAAYFGDMFSREEEALASKPPELNSPTF